MTLRLLFYLLLAAVCALAPAVGHAEETTASLEAIRVSDDGKHFVGAKSGQTFVVWGVNYDHDDEGRLLEDYWHKEWQTVEEDFREIVHERE